MNYFAIIETDSGLTIVELTQGSTAEDAAEAQGGVLVDAGPFPSYDDAYDALLDLGDDEDDQRE